jgi:hypothetical protein
MDHLAILKMRLELDIIGHHIQSKIQGFNYADILVGAKTSRRLSASRRLLKIAKLFGMAHLLMRRFFRGETWECYVRVNLHMIYWMVTPMIELTSRFNNPRLHGFNSDWGARLRLLPAPSPVFLGIGIDPMDYRVQNIHLNNLVRQHQQSLGVSSTELKLLIIWAVEAIEELRDWDAYMLGSSYPMMSFNTWTSWDSVDICDFLKQYYMLSRALRLLRREKILSSRRKQ